MSNFKDKMLIGRKEDIDLPKLKLKDLDAKVDTGAYTSSLHCHHIKVKEIDGTKFLTFKLLDPEHASYQKKIFKFKNFERKYVKSSNGQKELRYVIKTTLRIYGIDIETEFSLTDRSSMKHPVLLGRKFINQGFIVDVSKKNIASQEEVIRCKLIREKLS